MILCKHVVKCACLDFYMSEIDRGTDRQRERERDRALLLVPLGELQDSESVWSSQRLAVQNENA